MKYISPATRAFLLVMVLILLLAIDLQAPSQIIIIVGVYTVCVAALQITANYLLHRFERKRNG